MNPVALRLPAARRLGLATLLGAATSVLLAPVPRAAANLWTGNSATSGNWSDAANWGPDGAPVSSNDTALVFTGSSRLTNTQDLASPFILNSLTFDANAGVFVIGGNGLDFRTNAAGTTTPTLNQDSTATQTLGMAVTLTNNLAVNVSAAEGGLSILGQISGAGGLTKTGAGTLTLSGTNTYTGDTTVRAGTLAVSGGSFAGAGNFSVGAGATLAISDAASINLASHRSLTLDGTSASPASATLSGTTSKLSITEFAVVALNGTGTFSQSGGTVTLNNAVFVGNSAGSSGDYNLSGGSLMTGRAIVGFDGKGRFTQSGGTVLGSDVLTLGYNVGGSGSYTLSAGTLTTPGASVGFLGTGVFVQTGGTFTINGGLSIGSDPRAVGTYNLSGATSSLSTTQATIGSGGRGSFTQDGGSFTTNGGLLLLGSGARSVGSYTLNSGSLTTGATILRNNASSFTQNGGTHATGTLTLVDSGTANVAYNLNGGILTVNNVTQPSFNVTATFNFNGGTIQPRQDDDVFFKDLTTANVQVGGARFDTAGFNVTVAQALVHEATLGAGADGGLVKTSGGALRLTGANTYTGPTIINAGTLQVGAGGNSGTLGSGGNVVNNSILIFNRSDSLSVANIISGPGSVTQRGPGTLILSTANTYTGVTAVSGGTLTVSNDPGATVPTAGRLTNTGALTINNAGTLLLAGSASVTDRLNDAAPVTINGGGRLSAAGRSEGVAPTSAGGVGGVTGVGALTFVNTTSSRAAVLDFGSSGLTTSTLVFSSLDAVGKGAFVNVLNWTGVAGADTGATGNDRLLFATDPGFTTTDLANWQFRNDAGALFAAGAMQIDYNGYFELVPVVPEAGTWVAGGVGVLACAWSLRRRCGAG